MIRRFLVRQNLCLDEFPASYYKKNINDENDLRKSNIPEPVDSDDNELMHLQKNY